MLTIGQVAEQTNISVRTLHYYDEIDLLEPSFVSESGYRYYGKDDLLRLHQILVLKKLGFTLSKIKEMLKKDVKLNEKEVWYSALNMELMNVRAEKEKMEALEKMISVTINSIQFHEEIRIHDILLFIQSVQNNNVENFHNKNFTRLELEKMNLPDMRSQDKITSEWLSILKEVHQNRNEPVDSKVSQNLARRILAFVHEHFQDESLVNKYWDLLKPEKDDHEKAFGLDTNTVSYIEKIVQWYENHQGGNKQ